MKSSYALIVALIVCGCAAPTMRSAEQQELSQRGHVLVQQHCGSCHSVERVGESRAPEAPPFRTLSHNYRVSELQEALTEGISVGHPAMPQFQFTAQDTDAVIAYLQGIQDDPANLRRR